MGLSSPGIGSNLDVNNIVSQLMSVERQPLVRLQQKQAGFQAKLTAIGTLKGSLSSFQTAVHALSDLSKFQGTTVTPADTTIVTASGSATAVPGTYALEVSQLAKAQKLVAAGQATTSAAIGGGAATTLTFDFGTISGGTFDAVAGKYTGATFTSSGTGLKTVTINATNNSLAGIRDAINAAAIGVSATIVNDGSASPNRLVLTDTTTGLANSVKISVAGDAAISALLAHDPGAAPAGQALSETATAQNALFKVDGLSVVKSSNTVTDVIQGVTLNLAKTNAGSPTSIAVARDTNSVVGAVGNFVNAYNTINAALTSASAFDPVTKQAAILNGDEAVRALQRQIRGVLNAPIAGGAGAFTVLSQIGVTVQKDGTLAIDNTKLTAALGTNFSDVASLFAAVGKAGDSLVSYTASTANTKPGAYAVNITQLARQANVTGSAAAGLTITAGANDTLTVLLDGTSATVTLRAGTYTAATLASEVQSEINGVAAFSGAGSSVSVTQSAGIIKILSNRFGSGSSANVTAGNGLTNLLGATPVVTAGLDVAGSINGVTGTGSGQALTGATGDASEGLKLTISGGALGARGTVNFSTGYAFQFDQLATAQLGINGPLASRTDGINASLQSLTTQQDALNRRLADTEKRLRAQFTALDVAIGNMSKTSSFLTQQLAILTKPS